VGAVAFALVVAGLLWFAATDPKRFVLMTLVLAGLPMEVLTNAERFLSGSLDVDAQAIYMFAVLVGCSLVIAMRTARAYAIVSRMPAVVAFLALALASFAWADSVVYGLRMFVKLLTPLLFMWTAALATEEGLQAGDVARAVYGAAILLVGLAVTNLALHGALGALSTVPGLAGLPQLAAPYTSPSNFSFALAVAILIALGQWSNRRQAGYLVFAIALTAAVAFALCRAALAGLLVGYFAYSTIGREHPLRRLALAGGVVVVSAAVLFSLPEFRHRMFFDPESVSWSAVLSDPRSVLEHLDTSGRDQLWTAAAADFQGRSPWLGSGVGSVDRWIRDRDVRGSELHSDIYRLYLDLGAIGLGLFSLVLASCAAAALRGFRRGADRIAAFPVARVAVGALACYAATLPTDNSLNYVANFAVLVFGLLGCAMARGATVAGVPIVPADAPPRRFANVLE